MLNKNDICIQRCFDLARLGTGKVSPNPIVGALVRSHNEVLGEGFHQEYGQSHAEVIAVQNSLKKNEKNFKNATIFVSLEPCNIQGKTPPCSQLIIKHGIPKVVISAIDKTKGVNFSGIQTLLDNGQDVQHGILKAKGDFIARVRNTFVSRKRPYIILKYAQSADGYMSKEGQQTWLSNPFSKRLVHKWRSEIQAIMVGTRTVIIDDPQLTTRLYPGKSPLRITVDFQNKITEAAKLKDSTVPTWIFTHKAPTNLDSSSKIQYKTIGLKTDLLSLVTSELYLENHNTLLVEGGPTLLKSFIDADLWDEARIIQSHKMLHSGLKVPELNGHKIDQFDLDSDKITLLLNQNNVIYS